MTGSQRRWRGLRSLPVWPPFAQFKLGNGSHGSSILPGNWVTVRCSTLTPCPCSPRSICARLWLSLFRWMAGGPGRSAECWRAIGTAHTATLPFILSKAQRSWPPTQAIPDWVGRASFVFAAWASIGYGRSESRRMKGGTYASFHKHHGRSSASIHVISRF